VIKTALFTLLLLSTAASSVCSAKSVRIEADLLIVGGTESGWAAAIQAARMGVERIVLVNDIQWLGGQFTAEALVAIDENRSWEETRRRNTRRQPSIPRSGLFKELTDQIERFNRQKYGLASPGNTTVGTTCRPAEAEAIFRRMIKPYVDRGQIRIISNHVPTAAHVADDGTTLAEVHFANTEFDTGGLTVRAQVTIDATDFGDVIQQSGAAFDYGPDLKSDYGEPLAPEKREGYPLADMNPITYCMIVEETDTEHVIAKPPRYDERRYFNTTGLTKAEHDALPWPHRPVDAFATVDRVYQSRRIVDHYQLEGVKGPDAILLCWLVQDYPLDILPEHVNQSLEKTEPGASHKNIVVMSRDQRQIVFDDAKQHSLGMLHHLQTTVHERMADKTHSFRRFRLSDEFGTPDRLPFKPYVRESLRLRAMYVMRQQDTTPLGAESETYGRAMYHDGVTAWQFEYDYHMTGRTFLPNDSEGTAWQSYFKKGRTWGPPYAGLCLFPLRSLIPETVDGLLGAQKNLGYTSIVSSAIRLHDQCIHVGQAAGAAAAVSLNREKPLRAIPFDRTMLSDVRRGLCARLDSGQPMALWPFRDLKTDDEAYEAANMLAVSGVLPLRHDDVTFQPDEPATDEWRQVVMKATQQVKRGSEKLEPRQGDVTRGEFAIHWWKVIRNLPDVPFTRRSPVDADGDGIADADDALPLDAKNASLPMTPRPLHTDGLLDDLASDDSRRNPAERRFNFTGDDSRPIPGFTNDTGLPFDTQRGHGWNANISDNNRRRNALPEAYRDTFLFTRNAATWECEVPNGKWHVTVCVGDSAHEQTGQRVTVEGISVIKDVTTASGWFLERTVTVDVKDGRLTIALGPQQPGHNTCLNWVRVARPR